MEKYRHLTENLGAERCVIVIVDQQVVEGLAVLLANSIPEGVFCVGTGDPYQKVSAIGNGPIGGRGEDAGVLSLVAIEVELHVAGARCYVNLDMTAGNHAQSKDKGFDRFLVARALDVLDDPEVVVESIVERREGGVDRLSGEERGEREESGRHVDFDLTWRINVRRAESSLHLKVRREILAIILRAVVLRINAIVDGLRTIKDTIFHHRCGLATRNVAHCKYRSGIIGVEISVGRNLEKDGLSVCNGGRDGSVPAELLVWEIGGTRNHIDSVVNLAAGV